MYLAELLLLSSCGACPEERSDERVALLCYRNSIQQSFFLFGSFFLKPITVCFGLPSIDKIIFTFLRASLAMTKLLRYEKTIQPAEFSSLRGRLIKYSYLLRQGGRSNLTQTKTD